MNLAYAMNHSCGNVHLWDTILSLGIEQGALNKILELGAFCCTILLLQLNFSTIYANNSKKPCVFYVVGFVKFCFYFMTFFLNVVLYELYLKFCCYVMWTRRSIIFRLFFM